MTRVTQGTKHIVRGTVVALLAALAPASAQQRGGAAPAATLWQSLGDPALARLVDDALRGNQNLQGAFARLDGARAARFGAVVDLAPAVRVSGGYTRQRIASSVIPGLSGVLPNQGLWDAGVTLAWEVDVFGRVRGDLRGRGALVGATAEEVRGVQVLLAAEVADTYFALRGAERRLAVAEQNAENQRRSLELTNERLEGGRGTGLDVERAQAQLNATLAEVPTLQAAIVASRERLGVLTAQPLGKLEPMIAGAPSSSDAMALPAVPSEAEAVPALRQRPDLRRAEREVAARSAFVGAARAEYLPRFTVGGGAGYTGVSVDALGNTGTPRYSVASVVSWPAFDLGRVKASVDAARAGEAEAEARYAQLTLQARAEVNTALAAYQRARERLTFLDLSAAASERAAELARLRYTEGASDFLPVLDAERTMLDAQDRRALGRQDAERALVGAYRALGGAWPSGNASR